MTGVDSEWFLFSVRSDKTFPSLHTEHSGGTVRTESLYLYLEPPSAKKSSFFVPWEAGGPSPN